MSFILNYCKTHLQESDYIFLSTFFQNCQKSTLDTMEIINFEKNQSIMETGDSSTYVYVLLNGIVDIVDEKVPNVPFSFGEYSSIDVLGDYELFSNAPGRFVSLRAITKCTCIRIHYSDYMNWVKQDVNALFIRMNMLMSVLSRETQFLRQFIFLDIETRIIVYFYERYQNLGHQNPINIHVKREEIASKVACSIRTLNRLLQKIENKGFLKRSHGVISITFEQYMKMEEHLVEHEVSLYKLY